MNEAIEYADSPQARQMDRDIARRTDPSARSSRDEQFAQMEQYWLRVNAQNKIDAAASRARVRAAMVKVEAILGPPRK
jgi:hypothetical protein